MYKRQAFDKVARAVGLGYPGGPKVDKAAKEGNPHAMEFPRAKVADSPYDFSFSGLKSAVLNYINHAKMTGEEIYVPDLVASFQNAVVDVRVSSAITGLLYTSHCGILQPNWKNQPETREMKCLVLFLSLIHI